MVKVLIDPGHAPGNTNKGPTGYFEYVGVWKISTYLKEILQANGVVVDFTRTWEVDPGLYARGQKAKGYDLFISEHTNASNGTVRGVEVYYDYSKAEDKIQAEKLSLKVAAVMGNTNRGARTRIYTLNNNIYNYYGVIRGAAATDCNHIFLIESGFHDNEQDEAFLKVDENLQKIAQAQAEVILELLNVNAMTIQEAENIVKDKAKLNDNTMQYLRTYEYGDALLLKLAKAMK